MIKKFFFPKHKVRKRKKKTGTFQCELDIYFSIRFPGPSTQMQIKDLKKQRDWRERSKWERR